ncbi:MAG: DUF4349 domain-containing protein [Cyanobacteria bacterium J06635_15]
MKGFVQRSRLSRWALSTLSLVLLASCGASGVPTESGDTAMAPATAEAESMPSNSADGHEALLADTSTVPTVRSVLVKQANLSLTVESVDESLESIAEILVAQRGDLLELHDEQRFTARGAAYVTLRLRVPKDNLETTLTALKALGTLERQSITAEEVSEQLVDLEARLRNLRKSEESLLKIMERSGSIPEVLEVSRELSTVRASIEQIDAQLKALQNRVAYSTIQLQLTPVNAPQSPQAPLPETLGNTWQNAAESVSQLTVGLLKIGLWLLAYSPYFAFVAIALGLGYRLRNRQA